MDMPGEEQQAISNVVLFKEPDDDYVNALREYLPNRQVLCDTEQHSNELPITIGDGNDDNGDGHVQVSFCPLLDFEFCAKDTVIKTLEEIKRKEAHYDAFILTSPRAAEALSQAFEEYTPNELHQVVSSLSAGTTIYCVGKKTSLKLKEMGLDNVRGEDCGSADALKQLVEDDFADRLAQDEQKPSCIFFCGRKHRPAIPSLENEGFYLTKMVVYESLSRNAEAIVETLQNKNVLQAGSTLLWTHARRTILCIFSPSGVKTLSQAGVFSPQTSTCHLPQIIAIGPSTEEELQEQSLPCSKVSKEPSPQGIAEAARTLLDTTS